MATPPCTGAVKCPFAAGEANGNASKRIFTLSNGEVLWDWSGNVWEWLYGDGDDGTIGTTGGVTWRSATGWVEWNITGVNGLDEERPILGASSSAWTSSNGIGKYHGGASGNVFIRGGSWSYGVYAGAFALDLNYAPGSTGSYFGFRCAR